MTDDVFSDALEDLKAGGLLRSVITFDEGDGRSVRLDGREYLLFCSNDYLGLSRHPAAIAAAHSALDRFGFGSGGSRLISGSRTPHFMLEQNLRSFLGTEAALTFNSGFSANTGVIPAIAGKGDVILADRLNHASLVDGCLLSRAELVRYPHRDMAALERGLKKAEGAKNRWIITDGLFSMDGDMAPLDEICGLAAKYHARVMVDDAHAFGVLGKNGRGTPELFGVEGKIDILMGTLGKAAGGTGAFAAGKRSMVDFLLNRARSFIFSTAMPPAVAAANAAAVEVLAGFNDGRAAFLRSVNDFHNRLAEGKLAIATKSYIIPLVTEEAEKALSARDLFWEEGIFLQAVRPPAVPEGTARLRLTLSLSHTDADREKVLKVIGRHQMILGRATGGK